MAPGFVVRARLCDTTKDFSVDVPPDLIQASPVLQNMVRLTKQTHSSQEDTIYLDKIRRDIWTSLSSIVAGTMTLRGLSVRHVWDIACACDFLGITSVYDACLNTIRNTWKNQNPELISAFVNHLKEGEEVGLVPPQTPL